MSLENNPLKQYFRRPAVYLKLPSGGNYPATVLNMPENREIPVYPMTAIDDITAKTPDSLFNGQAVVDIIKSCLPNILDPWQINSIDIDSILIAIRTASDGSDFEVNTVCPNCSEDSKYSANLASILSNIKAPNYSKILQISDLEFKFKPLSFKEMNEVGLAQFELQRTMTYIEGIEDSDEKMQKGKESLKIIVDITMKALAKTIEYIKTPTITVQEYDFILDFLQQCDKNIFEAIKTFNADLKAGSEIPPFKIKCIHCQHEYEQLFTLNVSDFFG